MSCSPVTLPLPLNSDQDLRLKRKRSPSKEPAPKSIITHTQPSPKKPKLLRIIIPTTPLNSGLANPEGASSSLSLCISTDSLDSLFDDVSGDSEQTLIADESFPALRAGPPVPGLFFDPSVLLPQEIADAVVTYCMKTYFILPQDNQVMLFGRMASGGADSASTSGLPRILLDLLDTMAVLLQPVIPPETHNLLFPATPKRARQAIINLYHPGEGISPHVDLLTRYGDGIVGVSFSSGSVMRFDKVDADKDTVNRWDLYLPERSMVVLSEEARYGWTHAIEKKTRDFVQLEDGNSWIDRGTRISITFRWLLPGADIVGDSSYAHE